VTTPTNIVLALSSTGRPVATNLADDSIEPTLPRMPQRADGRPWTGSGNGVVFFPPRGRSRWAVRRRHAGVALLAVATTFGLALLALAAAYAVE
jgi:hypothetical protein